MARFAVLILIAFVLLHRYTDALVRPDGTCPIFTILPFSAPYTTNFVRDLFLQTEAHETADTGFNMMGAALLAIDHFNARDASVIPELAELSDCNVTLQSQHVVDSRSDPDTSVYSLVTYFINGGSNATDNNIPCAVLGPLTEPVALAVAKVTSGMGLPQLVLDSTSAQLMSIESSRSTVSTAWQRESKALAVLSYVHEFVGRDYLVYFGENTPSKTDLANFLGAYGRPLFNITVLVFIYYPERVITTQKEYLAEQILAIYATGVQTIYLDFATVDMFVDASEALSSKGMLENDYVYILSREILTADKLTFATGMQESNLALDQLVSGAIVIDRMSNYEINSDDPFLRAWRAQNASFVDRLNELSPVASDVFLAQPDYFEHVWPSRYAALIYDSVMTIGIGGCGQTLNMSPSFIAPTLSHDISLTPHVAAMTKVDFHGATGPVKFLSGEKVRDSHGITAAVYNIRPSTSGSQNVSYDVAITSIWTNESGWSKRAGEEFKYRGGATTVSSYSRRIDDANYLSRWVRAIGFILLGVVWLFDLLSMVLLFHLRNDAAVLRAQPIFLQLLCIGSIIMSSAIFTLSWDEGSGASDQLLDIACMATMWCFFVGYIVTFASLSTKLYRLDKVLQFRRGAKVTVMNVIGPLVLFLVATVVVLILWTVLDPWTWSQVVINELLAVSYGSCGCQSFWIYFGTLMGLVMFSEILTTYFAWKTSDVPDDFRDSSAVLYTVLTHLQAWAIGIPILSVLGTSSVDATYFGRVMLIWIFSISGVVFVISPKIVTAIRQRVNPNTTGNRTIRVSGLSSAPSHTTRGMQMKNSSSYQSEHFDFPAREDENR